MEASQQQQQQQQPPEISLCKLLLETNRVLKAQCHRLLSLAFLFLNPIFFSFQLYRVFRPLITSQIFIASISIGILLLLLTLFPSAVISITFTAFHGFTGVTGVVGLQTALESISASFFPLLATALVVALLLAAAAAAFALVLFATAAVAGPAAVYFAIPISVAFAGTVIYLLASWSLAFPVVVVESTWGFRALKRSRDLVKGKRRLVLALTFIFVLCAFAFVLGNAVVMVFVVYFWRTRARHYSVWWLLAISLADLLVVTAFVTILQLYKFVANTVLYVYCKASSGGGGGVLSGQYFPLPAGDAVV